MKRTAACAILLFSIIDLHAQATRTWISGVGDDANPCSRTAPGKTFAGAISKTAAGGEISVLDPGGFGAINITKSMTLNGDGTLAGILATGTNGIIINAGVNDVVTIRNISIKNPGGGMAAPSGRYGIRILQAGSVHIENCTIENGTDHGISFQPANSGAKLFVKDTTIVGCAGGGIQVIPVSSATATISNTQIQGCKFGVRSEQGAKVSISDSVVSGSANMGVVAAGTGQLNIVNTVISLNGSGGISSGAGGNSAIVYMSNTSVMSNGGAGLLITGTSQIISLGNNTIVGNSPDGSPTSTVAPK